MPASSKGENALTRTRQQESNTPNYEGVAAILRDAQRRLDIAQMKVAKRATRLSIRHAIQQTRDALAAAAHETEHLP